MMVFLATVMLEVTLKLLLTVQEELGGAHAVAHAHDVAHSHTHAQAHAVAHSFPTFFVSVQAEPCGAHPQADRP